MLAKPQPARQVSRTGAFDLPCDAETAFPLFSPEGERRWIKEWDPRPCYPGTVAFARDTVFREGEGEHEAVWTIVDADWQAFRAEYVRVAPSHSAHITVRIEPLGPDRSQVTVSYTVTTFAQHATLLEAFSETAYAAKMQNWQTQLREFLIHRHC